MVESLELRREFLALRLGPGDLYGLRACDRTVGVVYVGAGELDVGSPGPQRTPQMHGRSPDLPGTVLLDTALVIGTDGAVDDLLSKAGGLQEGPVPPGIWSLVQTRAQGFQLGTNTNSWRPPGELLAAPEGANGGVFVEVRTRGVRNTRPDRTLDVLSPWLSYQWAPAGAREPGSWFRRATGSTRGLDYGGFPREAAIADAGTPFALEEVPRPYDLLDVTVGIATSGPIGPDRMLETVEGVADLTLEAGPQASEHVLLSLMTGRRRVYGDLFAPLEVGGVSLVADGGVARSLPWLRSGNRLWVTLPETPTPGTRVHIRVAYEGDILEPAGTTSIRLLGTSAWYPRRPGVDRHTFTATVAVPPFWELAATGHRIGEEESGRVKTITSRARNPVTAGAVAIGDIRTEVVRPTDGLPLVRIHRNPEQPIPNSRFAKELKGHLQVLTDLLGPYPWSELEIVERGSGGGSTSLPGVITVPRFDSPPNQVVTTRTGGDSLLGALARQWLAVDRGVESYHDAWIITGLVTWARCLALEKAALPGRCYGELADQRRRCVDRMTSGQVSDDPTLRGLMAGSVWLGGDERSALVMHSLRLLLDDDVVRQTLRELSESNENLTLESLLVATQEASGVDLRAFVYGWVLNTPALPTARLRYQLVQEGDTWTLAGLGLIDDGMETEPPLPLPTPLLLAYEVGGETNILRIVLNEQEAALKVEGLPDKPRNIKLDPGKVFPGRVVLERME